MAADPTAGPTILAPRLVRRGDAVGAAGVFVTGLQRAIAGAAPLKLHGGGAVLRCAAPVPAVGSVVVKLERRRRFGPSRLARQWRGAELAVANGVPASVPVALLRGRDDRGQRIEALVLPYVDGRSALEEIARPSSRAARRRTLVALGELTGRLVAAGLLNRDHKPSNIVIAAGGGPVLVDTMGIRPLRRGETHAATVRMLANLLVECLGVGARPSRADCLRALLAAEPEGAGAWKRRWHELRRRVESHGDPTPRTDPLSSRG